MQLGPNQIRWLEALERGGYRQASGNLCIIEDDGSRCYCCLGVGAQLFCPGQGEEAAQGVKRVLSYDDDAVAAPAGLMAALAFHDKFGRIDRDFAKAEERQAVDDVLVATSLSELNDQLWSFEDIAAFARRYPHLVFSEPR